MKGCDFLSDSTLKEILNDYYKKRNTEIATAENKKNDFYNNHPDLKDIDFQISSLSVALAKSRLSSDNDSDNKKISLQLEKLKTKKENILDVLHIDKDSFLPKFECSICNDTGYISKGISTVMCSCLKQKLFDEKYNKLNVYNIKGISFDDFSLSKYSDKINKEKYNSEVSPKKNMEFIFNVANTFVKNFNNSDEKNLLFVGNTGLGKTFLSSCIANAMVSSGKTVLYQTAPVMFDEIINHRMSKENDFDILKYLLSVDLLIIDDLGTESMNSMKFSDLYTIINSRLLNQNKKVTKTIISSNLNLDELSNRYGEIILSRFVGNYNICYFYGDDIRFNNK